MILIEEKGRSEQGEIVAAKRQDNRVRISLSLWKDKGTTQGHLLEYLDCDLENGKSKAELAMEALSAYWLPLALKYKKVKGERLKSAGRRAIAQLMQQIEIIRLECGLRPDEMPFGDRLHMLSVAVPTVQTPSVPTPTAPSQAFEDEEEDDDEEYLTVDSFEESATI